VRLKRRADRKDHRNNSASLVGIVHRGRKAIVHRAVRVVTTAVRVVVAKAGEDLRAGQVAAADVPLKGSLRSN
jgi:hypothetical protein